MAASDPNELRKDLEAILEDVAYKENMKNYELVTNLTPNIGDGFVAQLYIGEVKNKDTTINVAIKKAPLLKLTEYAVLFKNEELFYTTIFPALDYLQKSLGVSEPFENVPTFFCAGRELDKEFIAMENLKTLGYVMFDKKKYLDKEHLEFIFKIYGKFHGLSFVLKKRNEDKYKEIHREMVDVYQTVAEILSPQLKDAMAAAIESLDHNSSLYHLLEDLPEYCKELFLKTTVYMGTYRCCTHGDCWSNNMLFKYTECGKLHDVKLIDFQLVRDGTPIHDLSYFLYSGASKTDMDDIEYYLKIYHDSLSKSIMELGENPEDIFPFDVLLKEWKENALLGIFMGIYLWQIKLTSKDELSEILTNSERSDEEKHKVFSDMMEKLYKSDAFRERTTALLIHAYDYGVITKERISLEKQ